MSAKYSCCIAIVPQIVAIVIFWNVRATSSVAVLWVYALIAGLSSGAWLPTMSMLTSTTFGLTAYGAIYGMLSFIQAIGSAAGPLTAAFFYDTRGNYFWALVIFLALAIVAGISILLVRRPDKIGVVKGG